MARSTGTCVLWKGGYGFIEVDAEGEGDKQQVFCHHSVITVEEGGFRALEVGQKVEFDIIDEGNGKFKAQNVTAPKGAAVASGSLPASRGPRAPRAEGGRVGGRCAGSCVAWKGAFGYIEVDGDKQQVFCHHSVLTVEEGGFRALEVGQKVEFDMIDEGNGKFKAQNVTAPKGAALPSGPRPAAREDVVRGDGRGGGRRGGRE